MVDTEEQRHDHHHHHDGHGDESSFSERNRAHWDKLAAIYTSDHFQKEFGDLLNKVMAFILSNISWIGVEFLNPAESFEVASTDTPSRSVRVLDYACGPGTITSALAGYASEYVGIDLNEKMVEQYNKRLSQPSDVKSQIINAHAVVGNLLATEGPSSALSGPEFNDFDLVAVGLGFHHFENLTEVTRRLVERVKPGGILIIVDFLPHAKNDLDNGANADLISHHGFPEGTIQDLFTGAGLEDVDLRIMDEPVMLRGKAPRTVFLARGRKPT